MAKRKRRPWTREFRLTLATTAVLLSAGWAGPIWVWASALERPERLTFAAATLVAVISALGAVGALVFVRRTRHSRAFVRCWFLLFVVSAGSSFLAFVAFNLVAAQFGPGRILPVCLLYLLVTVLAGATATMAVLAPQHRRGNQRNRPRKRVNWLGWGVLAVLGSALAVITVGQFVPSFEQGCFVYSNENTRLAGARHANYQQRVSASCGEFRVDKDYLRGHFWDAQVQGAIVPGETYDFALTGFMRRNIVAVAHARER